MHIIKKTKDPIYRLGIILLIVSLFIFLVPDFFPAAFGSWPAGAFILNYLLTVVYFIFLLARGKLKRSGNGIHHFTLLLILFLVSAYALNREMGVFERSTPWFCAVLVIISINYIVFVFFDRLPRFLRYLLSAVAGLAMIVFIYLSVYLMPIYLISVVGLVGMGISLHAFVPAVFCLYTWRLIQRVSGETQNYRAAFFSGMAITMLFAGCYVFRFSQTLQSINHHFQYASIVENNQLPPWTTVAQQISTNSLTERILKTDLVYSVPAAWSGDFFWRMPRLNFEQRVHDPLVMLASFFCGKVHVPEEQRIKILETLYDSRHSAQERLWSGDDIKTENVMDNVQIWPKLRVSYSQVEMIITHAPRDASWRNQQEAIYTFHLLEGGVVTSLSLWINGKEEKGMLTSKAKADSAYREIVGVERRDPSVVHWQEGNTVTVRVFPVLNGESRKFKLGITAPLREENGRLYYDNIYFDGPSSGDAEQHISVRTMDHVTGLLLPPGFAQQDNVFTKDGNYSPSWSMSFTAPTLSGEAFHFGNYSYQVLPMQRNAERVNISSVYLDINDSWSLDTCEKVYALAKSAKVYVSEGGDEFTQVSEDNKKEIFEKLRQGHFSLFPFHKISHQAGALVVTHSGPSSPVIHDIRNSEFMNQTAQYFKDGRKVRVLDLGTELSPYLKSLKEFRMLDYDRGGLEKLKNIFTTATFNTVIEDDNNVAIEGAGVSIKRTDGSITGNAPDHLMRLFAYNHILQESGHALLTDSSENDAIVREAQEAYVVSPVSSLVVLETQKDYDRFNITSSKTSLQNASLKSKGSVPEPGEWALIILVVAIGAFIRFSPRLSIKAIK